MGNWLLSGGQGLGNLTALERMRDLTYSKVRKATREEPSDRFEHPSLPCTAKRSPLVPDFEAMSTVGQLRHLHRHGCTIYVQYVSMHKHLR